MDGEWEMENRSKGPKGQSNDNDKNGAHKIGMVW